MTIELAGTGLARKILGPGFISFASKVASAVLSFTMLVVFARLMTPQEFGAFGISFNLAILLSTVLGLGLPVGIMRFYPQHLASKQIDLARGVVTGSLKAISVATIICLVVAAMASLAGFAQLDKLLSISQAALWVTLFAGVVAVADYIASTLRAQGSTAWSAIPRDIFWRIAAILLAAIYISTGTTLTNRNAVLICIATLLVITLLQVKQSLRVLKQDLGPGPTSTAWHAWRKPLLPLWTASILFALVQQFDVVVVGSLLGAEAAGPYFAAQKIATLLALAMMAGGQIAAPLMAAAYHAGNLSELRRICKTLALAIAGVTLIGLFILLLIGRYLLTAFDPSFVTAYAILMIFAVAVTVDSVSGPTAYLMQVTSLETTYLKIMAACYAGVIALQLIFVPYYGVLAAALCSAAGVITWNIIAIYILRRRIGVDPSLLGFILPHPQKS